MNYERLEVIIENCSEFQEWFDYEFWSFQYSIIGTNLNDMQ